MWNPETHPYRVRVISRTSAEGCYGWRDSTRTFATETEAREFAGAIRAKKVEIAKAAGTLATWPKNCRWQTVR